MKLRSACSHFFLIFLLSYSNLAFSAVNLNDCSNDQASVNYWNSIASSLDTEAHDSDELAPILLSCLASENSILRDNLAYGLLTYWLRTEALGIDAKLTIYSKLLQNMQLTNSDDVLVRSFSALVMSEVLRADTQENFLSTNQRIAILNTSLHSLSREVDYRGLEPDIGWVHPIAHFSDVLWRFALDPRTTVDSKKEILAALKEKVGSANQGFRFNEGDRFARVAAVIIQSGELEVSDITDWLDGFKQSTDNSPWNDSFSSQQGMIELHNAKLFIRALSDQTSDYELNDAVEDKLTALVTLFTKLV